MRGTVRGNGPTRLFGEDRHRFSAVLKIRPNNLAEGKSKRYLFGDLVVTH